MRSKRESIKNRKKMRRMMGWEERGETQGKTTMENKRRVE